MISVMRNKFVRSWPADGERVYARPCATAFARAYTTDAHFAQYTSTHRRRLSRGAIEAGAVATIGVIVLDVDCPETHGSPEPAPESWRAEMLDKVKALADAHPGPFYYETKGGSRIVYRQPVDVEIATIEDATAWSQDYAVTVAYVARVFGIVADPACADWTRLFRLPRATRGDKPEQWPMYGDPEDIGVLTFVPDVADVEAAKKKSKAFSGATRLDFTASQGDGRGVLYHALRARGALVRAHGKGAFVIRCPRESSHSCGKTGDGSTLLYPPATGEHVGAIHCLHGHCSNMTTRDWMREFSKSELEMADEAAGTRRRA